MSNDIALEPIHHIVCAVESEEASAPAIAEAARITVPLNARLSVVHICGTVARFSGGTTTRGPSAEQLQDELVADAHRWLDPLAQRMNGEAIELVGDLPARTLGDWAREQNADMIVVCPHRRGLAKLLGSFAAELVREAPCPIVLAPHR